LLNVLIYPFQFDGSEILLYLENNVEKKKLDFIIESLLI